MNSQIYSNELLESMKIHLSDNAIKFITYPKFVFLCGAAYANVGYENTNRGIMQKYLKSKSEDIFFVLSEELWEDGFDSNIDLLTFEEFLAEVSDSIILFVESPGSFCELGAFSYAEKLFSDKLIIVIDKKYEGDKSFIITGPTAKAKKDGAKVVFAPLSGKGLLSSTDLRKVIDEVTHEFASKNAGANKRNPNSDANSIRVNTFILELLELIKILQPVSRKDLIEIYKQVKGFSSFTFVKKDGTEFHNEIKYDYMRCTTMFLSEEDRLHETREWKRWAHQELHMVCEAEGYSFFAVGDYENALWSFEEAADLIERFWNRKISNEYALLQGPYVAEGLARLASAGCLYKLGRLEECDVMIKRAYHLIRDFYDDSIWERCKEQRLKEYREVYHKVGLDEYKPCI